MNLAFAFHQGDSDAALRWLRHTALLNQRAHDLYLLPERGVDSSDHLALTVRGWKTVTELSDGLGVRSNWSSNDEVRSARGPNTMFRQLAGYFRDKQKGAWMFCEPDCIPLKDGWLDAIEAEYHRAKKPFMGALVEKPFRHITGNMVCSQYAANMVCVALPTMDKSGTELAFDLAAAGEILPQSHVTSLIQHVHRAPPFTSREDFEARVRKDAVLFHACKDGSIYEYIRDDLNTLPGGAGASDPKKHAPCSDTRVLDEIYSDVRSNMESDWARDEEKRKNMKARMAKMRLARGKKKAAA